MVKAGDGKSIIKNQSIKAPFETHFEDFERNWKITWNEANKLILYAYKMKQRKKSAIALSCCQWQRHQSVNTNNMRWITCLYALNNYCKNETTNLCYKNLEKLNRINPSFILNFPIKVSNTIKPQALLITWSSGEYQRESTIEFRILISCMMLSYKFPESRHPSGLKKKEIDEGNGYPDIFSLSRASFRTF